MNINSYKAFFTKEYLMGPNSLKLLHELITNAPDAIPGGYVLDLGCGTGVTSLFLAKETRAEKVFATDLWVDATSNWQRAQSWEQQHKLIPIHADAHTLPFANGFFQSIVSVDAYHYFGCEEGLFASKILPLLAPGGSILLAMPGIRDEAMQSAPLMQEWAGEEAALFHSPAWWVQHLTSEAEGIAIKAYESAHFQEVWEDWFATGHEYAMNDKAFIDRGLRDMLTFVMLEVRMSR
ncbi:MAG: methyltransferase domain-containing protein [Clostridia bacterium]|nr:methyltransferase domain-containing protein [Clostridia bacterium]